MRVVIFYISLLIYPHPSRLNLDHDFALSSSLFSPLTTFLSLLFIINSLALAIFMIKRYPLVSYAIVWFFGNLLIESSIIPLELVFEHRVYLPSMGLIILAIGLGVSLFKKEWRKWITYLSILLILIFSYWTYERSFVWRGPFSLWMDAVKKSPHKARPYNNLGIAYGIKGKWDEAIEKYKQALNISPYFAEAHSNLGNAYNKKGMFDQAISECTRAIAIKPNFAEPHTVLGIVYQKRGELDKAISEYKKAIIIKPNFAKAHTNLGAVYGRKGRLDEAISEYEHAIAIKPHYAEAYNKLATAYFKQGRLDEAISECKKAIAIKPNLVEAYYKLGSVLEAQGKLREAISAYHEAIRIKPDYQAALNNLAWIYATSPDARIRDGGEAIALATKAYQLSGFKKAEALDTLAAAYAEQGNFNKAMEYQNRAVEVASPEIKKDLKMRLQLYKEGHAYRDQ